MGNDYLLISLGPNGEAMPIGAHLRDLMDARQALRWQDRGGLGHNCRIATVSPSTPDLVEVKEGGTGAGRSVKLVKGCLTDEAFTRLLAAIRGEG